MIDQRGIRDSGTGVSGSGSHHPYAARQQTRSQNARIAKSRLRAIAPYSSHTERQSERGGTSNRIARISRRNIRKLESALLSTSRSGADSVSPTRRTMGPRGVA